MADIFISYARTDRDIARQFADAFTVRDWTVWWDPEIPYGQSFDEVIERELAAARCVIVLWSKDSVSSRWVRTEADEGLNRRILVPILIGSDVSIPLAFRRLQAANLVGWTGDREHAVAKRVFAQIEQLLGPRTSGASIKGAQSNDAREARTTSSSAPPNREDTRVRSSESTKSVNAGASGSRVRPLLDWRWFAGAAVIVVAVAIGWQVNNEKPVPQKPQAPFPAAPAAQQPPPPQVQTPTAKSAVPEPELPEAPKTGEAKPPEPRVPEAPPTQTMKAASAPQAALLPKPRASEKSTGTATESKAAPASDGIRVIDRSVRIADLPAGQNFRDYADWLVMVVIPAGSFQMGSPPTEVGCDSDEGPQHAVNIQRPLAIGKFEVTFAEWDMCVSAGGCKHRPDDNKWGRINLPVINVNWADANEFAAWLSGKAAKKYRLPSGAEWEYAARAGMDTRYPWGNDVVAGRANYYGSGSQWSNKQTAPVGSFAPNNFGLHDMIGNVWEWTLDCWNDSYNGAPADGSARTSGSCGQRVVRGGSWDNDPQHARAADRSRNGAADRSGDLGFRLARTEND